MNEKTYCKKGHEHSGINSQGRKICKTCINERMRKRYQDPKNRNYQLDWQKKNKDKVNMTSKRWRKNNPHFSKKWDEANPDKRKAIHLKHEAKPERKEYMRVKQLQYYHLSPEKYKAMQKKYREDHPRSGAGYSLEEQIAMDQRRIIDKNVCQWGKCGLTHKGLE